MFISVWNLISYLVYGLCGTALAIFSAMIISESYRKAVFAKFFTSAFISGKVMSLFAEHRPVYLKGFAQTKVSGAQKLNVLEVGVGSGMNFEVYPDNCRLTVLDFNDNFKEDFMKNIRKYPNIEFVEYLTGSVEDMQQIKDNTFDVVLNTHLFCSVPDVYKGLREIRRVLKEGGKYYFMEHVAYLDRSGTKLIWSLIQDIMTPFWRIMMCNCELNRKTWLKIKDSGFSTVVIHHEYPDNVPGFIRAHIWGSATK